MSKKLKLILDANAIIELFTLEIWDQFIELVDVTTSDSILNEVDFYKTKHGEIIPIDKQRLNRIVINNPEIEDLRNIVELFDDFFLQSIHEGERGIISFLNANKYEDDYKLCAGDGVVIKCLALLDMSERGISLESVLNQIGLTKHLRGHFRDQFFRDCLKIGVRERIQGVNLRR